MVVTRVRQMPQTAWQLAYPDRAAQTLPDSIAPLQNAPARVFAPSLTRFEVALLGQQGLAWCCVREGGLESVSSCAPERGAQSAPGALVALAYLE